MANPSSATNPNSLSTDTPAIAPVERVHAFQVAHTLGNSFVYAAQGIYYGLRTQRNFRIHTLATIVVLAAGIMLGLPNDHIAILALTCGAVMALELVNTALEAVVDLAVQQTYHELAKIAKDCAAGAVLVAALTAVIVGACLLVPPILDRLMA